MRYKLILILGILLLSIVHISYAEDDSNKFDNVNVKEVQINVEVGFFDIIRYYFRNLLGGHELRNDAGYVITRSPIAHLSQFTQIGLDTHAREVCLGGLIMLDSAPIIGDINGRPILHPVFKFGNDMEGSVVNGYLECKVPCSNPNAQEIRTAYGFDNRPLPFTLSAIQVCN